MIEGKKKQPRWGKECGVVTKVVRGDGPYMIQEGEGGRRTFLFKGKQFVII